jgi:hypothetical protein
MLKFRCMTFHKYYQISLKGVSNLLQTLADAPAIHNNEYKRAFTVVNSIQYSSSQITDFYMWLDRENVYGNQ